MKSGQLIAQMGRLSTRKGKGYAPGHRVSSIDSIKDSTADGLEGLVD